MRKTLLCTVCYPVLNLAVNLAKQTTARDTEEYRKWLKNQEALRYKAIFRGRPYQPILS